MWFAFVLISLTLSAISGSETCKGPYELPKLLEVTTTPVYKEGNHILEAADVSLVVRSGSPIHTAWWYLGAPRAKEASEDDEDLRPSDEVFGDRHILKLHVKLAEENGVKNVTEILDLIHISLQVMYDCNTVMLPMRLDECIDLIRADVPFPSITMLPRAQYITDSSNQQLLKMTLSNGMDTAPEVDTNCHGYIVRKDGVMRMLSYREKNPIQSRSEKSVYLGATETTCEIDVEEDLESFYVQMHQRINLDLTDGPRLDITLLTVTEFRRSGITTPAVDVRGRDEEVSEREGDVKVIPTSENVTNIVCLAEAASKPHIALAKLTKGGNYQILLAKTGYSQFYVSLNMAHYPVLSPTSLLKGEEYICSAANGQEVASQRFRILRYEAVDVKSMTDGGDAVYMEAVGTQQYNLTCEATGAPQPKVKFYWTPNQYYGRDVKYFQEINKDHEMHDSDVIETTTRVEGTKTYGTIIIKDVKKIIADLSDSFWQDYYSYDIVCLGYNEYSYTSVVLGHSVKPNDWDLSTDHLTNTTLFL